MLDSVSDTTSIQRISTRLWTSTTRASGNRTDTLRMSSFSSSSSHHIIDYTEVPPIQWVCVTIRKHTFSTLGNFHHKSGQGTMHNFDSPTSSSLQYNFLASARDGQVLGIQLYRIKSKEQKGKDLRRAHDPLYNMVCLVVLTSCPRDSNHKTIASLFDGELSVVLKPFSFIDHSPSSVLYTLHLNLLVCVRVCV